MFKQMRRQQKELSYENAERILKSLSHATLALNGDDGYPYSVPISYVYDQGKIYFHGANAGYKYQLVQKNNKVCLSAIAKDEILPSKFNTNFQSVIAYGRIRILEDETEIQEAMEQILMKYSSEFMEQGRAYIKASQNRFCAYEIEIEHLNAKGVPLDDE